VEKKKYFVKQFFEKRKGLIIESTRGKYFPITALVTDTFATKLMNTALFAVLPTPWLPPWKDWLRR